MFHLFVHRQGKTQKQLQSEMTSPRRKTKKTKWTNNENEAWDDEAEDEQKGNSCIRYISVKQILL